MHFSLLCQVELKPYERTEFVILSHHRSLDLQLRRGQYRSLDHLHRHCSPERNLTNLAGTTTSALTNSMKKIFQFNKIKQIVISNVNERVTYHCLKSLEWCSKQQTTKLSRTSYLFIEICDSCTFLYKYVLKTYL